MTIQKTYYVQYAHRLDKHPRACYNLHGHSGKVTIVLEGPVISETGMVKDFGELAWLKDIIDAFDHCLLMDYNDPVFQYLLVGVENGIIPPLDMYTFEGRPTAETCASALGDKIKKYLRDNQKQNQLPHPLKLKSIAFEETIGNEAKQEY